MALAFDNDFDYVFILTKSNKALVKQTYQRMRREFKKFIYDDLIEVYDIMKMPDDPTNYELNKKLIIIAKKEKNNLKKISKFIKDYADNKKCLIIDDEADTTSIGYEKNRDSVDEFDLRTVASEIDKIRGNLDGYVFVQVTATPYALYLQPDFDNGEIKPVKPLKSVLVPYGKEYIGGEYYFLQSDKDFQGRFLFDEILDREQELASAKISDRRRFKEEEILIKDDMPVFRKGIINFIMGGCIMNINGYIKKYAYVIHTAVAQKNHARLAAVVKILIDQIKENRYSVRVDQLLKESYDDLERSIKEYEFSMPGFDETKEKFFDALEQGMINKCIINSTDEIDKYLDEDTGELKLRTPFSIFVGGQVLDRGITIPNMVGFYYGRNPKTVQQDTVMQHSRMFGYRSKDLLAITRFYTTKRIYENMVNITQIDIALRDDIENGRFEDGICFIEKRCGMDGTAKIVPCSPSKIAASNVVYLKPSYRVLPVGFLPKEKKISEKIVQDIDDMIQSVLPKEQKNAELIDIDKAEELIKKAYSCLDSDKDAGRFVSLNRMISILRYVVKDNNQCFLIVRRNRNISKYTNNKRYSDAPDEGEGVRRLAKEVAVDIPCLTLLHQKGNDSWKNREFWWPILTLPKNTVNTMYSLPETSGNVKKR